MAEPYRDEHDCVVWTSDNPTGVLIRLDPETLEPLEGEIERAAAARQAVLAAEVEMLAEQDHLANRPVEPVNEEDERRRAEVMAGRPLF